jgi:hypothetical protein
MEAAGSYETLKAVYKTVRYHVPEYRKRQRERCLLGIVQMNLCFRFKRFRPLLLRRVGTFLPSDAATVEHVKFCVYIGIISRSREASRIEEVETISDFLWLLTRLTKATVDSFKGCIQEFTSIHTPHPSLCNY